MSEVKYTESELKEINKELTRVLFDLSENVKTLPDVRDLPIMSLILKQSEEILNNVLYGKH